jgi:hypothetical protein
MSCLDDLPELVGFFSYSREDDEGSDSALSALRERIQHELRAQLGRSRRAFRLWQDKQAIAAGKLWEAEIKTAVSQSVFFMPIITPTAVKSPYCKFELEAFLAREAELGRDDLVFPILYMKVPELENRTRQKSDLVLSTIAKRQYVDWREFRHSDVRSKEVKEAVERFCSHVCEALRREWVTPEERKAQEEAAALERAEAERKRREAEAKRSEEEARRKAAEDQARQRAEEERRQREVEAEQKRLEGERERAEERRLRQEADAKRRAEAEERRRRRRAAVLALWPPSRPTKLVASLVSVAVLGAIAVWIVNPTSTPAPIASAPVVVAPPTPAPSSASEPVPVPPPSGSNPTLMPISRSAIAAKGAKEELRREEELRRKDLDGIRRMLSQPVRYYITSGRKEERVTNDSTFATLLLRGLRGGADFLYQGLVSADQLGIYLSREVPKYSPQTPQSNHIANAKLSEGQFFFLSGITATRSAEEAAAEQEARAKAAAGLAQIPEDIQKLLRSRGHALLIGQSRYTRGWDELASVRDDLQNLKAGLTPHFETVETVQNLTVSQLRDRMREFLLGKWNMRDARLFIYYAGHGFTDFNQASREVNGYITGSDTPRYDLMNAGKTIEQAVPFTEIDGWNWQTGARHVLMVFDSSFSLTLFQTRAPP